MTHIVIDLETMGTKANAAIIAIGAVAVNEVGEIVAEFYRRIDLESAIWFDRGIDGDTVMWWLKQSEAARTEITKPGGQLDVVLNEFSQWFHSQLGQEIWGNGPSFDCGILAESYRVVGQALPWNFWNERCIRTLLYMNPGLEISRSKGTHHNALDDAKAQAVPLRQWLQIQTRQ